MEQRRACGGGKWASVSDLVSGVPDLVCDVAVKTAVLWLFPRCLGQDGSCFVFAFGVSEFPLTRPVVQCRCQSSMAVLKRQCGLPPFQLLSFRFVFKSAFRNLVDWFHWPLLVLFFCLIVPLPPDAIYDNVFLVSSVVPSGVAHIPVPWPPFGLVMVVLAALMFISQVFLQFMFTCSGIPVPDFLLTALVGGGVFFNGMCSFSILRLRLLVKEVKVISFEEIIETQLLLKRHGKSRHPW
ncbi:hypothetical protein Bca101_063513 [Brassica carinata]